MDDMMKALTTGLGADLGKTIWRDYFTLKDAVSRKESWSQATENQQQLVIDMLALSIFQRLAMTPIHGASSFLESTRRDGVKSVRMGKYSLGRDFQQRANTISRTFFAITKKHGIEIRDLAISDIDSFIETWITKQQDGYGLN